MGRGLTTISPGGKQKCGIPWSTSTHKQPIHSSLEDTQVIYPSGNTEFGKELASGTAKYSLK